MLGIIVPLPAECRSLCRHKVRIGDALSLAPGISVRISGMGPQRAVAAAQALKDEGANAILNWGCAAALEDTLQPGQLLLPETLITTEGKTVAVDGNWRARIQDILTDAFSILSQPLTASNDIVATPASKQSLRAATGAIAVDMESAALACWAEEQNIPFVTLRAVADHANSGIPEAVLMATDDSGGIAVSCLLRHLLRHPTQIFDLLSLGHQFSKARVSLASAGGRLLPHNFCLPS